MSSIIDRIDKAEETADKIRKDASAKSRDIVIQAEETVKTLIAKEREDARTRLREANEKAQLEGSKTVDQIMNEMHALTEAKCKDAKTRLPGAVSYLLERVEKS